MAIAINTSELNAFLDDKSQAANFYTEATMSNDMLPWLRRVGGGPYITKADTLLLPTLDSTVIVQSGDTCTDDFDNGNDSTIGGKEIALKKAFIGDTICAHDDLESYFTAQLLPQGQHYGENLGPLGNAVLADIGRKVGKKIANLAWVGPTGGDSISMNGWLDLILAGPALGMSVAVTTPTDGGSAGTDAAGAFNLVETLAGTIYGDQDLAGDANDGNWFVTMSPKDARLYFRNYRTLYGDHLITPALQQLANGSFAAWQHPGTNMTVLTQNALTGTGYIIAHRRGVFALAVDLESDFTRLRTGMDQYEESYWWKYRFKMGPGFRNLTSKNLKFVGPAS